MKTKLLTVLATIVVIAVIPMVSFAHHGSAAYDMTKVITVKATVTGLMWANPHTMLNFDVKDDKGGVSHWALEMYNPLWMTRAGWNKSTLKPGDEIVTTFHPAKNGTGNGYIHLPECNIMFHGRSINLDENGAGGGSSSAAN